MSQKAVKFISFLYGFLNKNFPLFHVVDPIDIFYTRSHNENGKQMRHPPSFFCPTAMPTETIFSTCISPTFCFCPCLTVFSRLSLSFPIYRLLHLFSFIFFSFSLFISFSLSDTILHTLDTPANTPSMTGCFRVRMCPIPAASESGCL